MKDTRLNIRVTVELKEQAKKLAEADGRNLSGWITWLIRKEIEKAAANLLYMRRPPKSRLEEL